MSESQLRQEVAQLRAELERVDNWATGVFQVLQEVLEYQLGEQPGLAAWLEPMWREASQRFDEVDGNTGQPAGPDETVERLEARKMLYRMFSAAGLWSRPDGH